MSLTPMQIFTLALERHRQPWNWTFQFSAIWIFCLTLLFHSYLLLATTLILFGTGFFHLEIPERDNRWFTFVKRGITWEKDWIAAPWNWRKWWRFTLCLFIAGVFIWALWLPELAALMLLITLAYLWKVMLENKDAGIEP